MKLVRVAALLAAATSACAHGQSARFPRAAVADAPVDLSVAADRAWERDRFAALAVDDPTRPAERARLATAENAAIEAELKSGDLATAADEVVTLVALWHDDPDTAAAGLAASVPALEHAADQLGRHGVDRGALIAHLALAAADPAHAAAHQDEIEAILAYLDDLGTADAGPAAAGQAPIAALEPLARAWPNHALVERTIAMIQARQTAFNQVLSAQGASKALVDAAGDIFDSARRVAALLAIAGRSGDIALALAASHGLGDDPQLEQRALALRGGAASAWIAMAAGIDGASSGGDHDGEAGDAEGALALMRSVPAAIAKQPEVLGAAASYARTAGHRALAVDLLVRAIAAQPASTPDVDAVDALVALRAQAIEALAAADRLDAARAERKQLDAELAPLSAGANATARSAWQAAAALALGRALTGQGLLDEARRQLAVAAAAQPSLEAYAELGFIDAQRGDPRAATADYQRGLDHGGDPVQRARVDRLIGDAASAAGEHDTAMKAWLSAWSMWESLGGHQREDLPPEVIAHRLVESGKVLWNLGEPDKAREFFAAASESAPDDHGVIADTVRFLLDVDDADDAVLAFHQGVGSPQIADGDKVRFSLWLAADARHRGVDADARALTVLGARTGDSALDLIARAASGHLAWANALGANATPAQQAQYDYYRATLDSTLTPAAAHDLLAKVVAAEFIETHEYDDAHRRVAATP